MKTRNCKQCGEIFEKLSPLQFVCSRICESKYKAKNRSKKIGNTKEKKLLNNEPNEAEIFEKIWNERERISFVTGKPLSDRNNARAWYFSHVLPKGKAKFPMFKYYAKNIVLKEFKEHEQWEYHQKDLADNPLWNHVFELKQELLEEYSEHLKLFEQGLVGYYKIS